MNIRVRGVERKATNMIKSINEYAYHLTYFGKRTIKWSAPLNISIIPSKPPISNNYFLLRKILFKQFANLIDKSKVSRLFS